MNNIKIKNIEKVAERITRAVKNKERIILYGDSDMDGICSVVILEEAIKNLGGDVFLVVFPDRENDGYGINLRALDFLKKEAPALFITLDLGIGNIKEVEMANAIGFEVIIIDHHEILNRIPNASLVIDPKQEGDNSKLTHLANVGVTFKLCVVALATISDMVAQIGDNKIFIEEGLRSLKNTFRPGLRAFLHILGEGEVVSGGFLKIISSLNAAESQDFKNESYELLTSSSDKKCMELAQKLIDKTNYKQQIIKNIVQEMEKRIAQKPNEAIIFEGDPAWKLTLAGPVASIIAAKYQKPTFIYKKMDNESCGSVRSLKEGENSVDAMKSCADILVTYGGHPKASGFRVKNENIEEFKERLNKYFKK
ncbi:MAG: hypothetical protein UR46_C0010G0003 [Parcubacteria group bacterium GW2011_GWA1_33_6]|nr:MAG: hypothetical protein UR46_C0010G0003 [Parcubacteria group bacterium GW2011_GWA1_33_6]